jgi:hypothetical protein
MNKNIQHILTVLLLLTGMYNGCDRNREDYSPIFYAVKYDYDLGYCDIERMTAKLPFRNTGNVDLVVAVKKTSCGCISAILSNETISENEEGYVEIQVDTTGKTGIVNASILLETNDKRKPQVIFNVSSKVRGVRCDPLSVAFGEIVRGSECPLRKLVIESYGDYSFEVTDIQCSNRLFEIEEYAVNNIKMNKEDKAYHYFIHANIPDDSIGTHEGVITVQTMNHDEIKIPVVAKVVGPVKVVPPVINFGIINREKISSRSFVVKSLSDRAVDIEKIEGLLQGMRIAIKGIRDGEMRCNLEYESSDIAGLVKGSIVLYVKHDGSMEKIFLPYTAIAE